MLIQKDLRFFLLAFLLVAVGVMLANHYGKTAYSPDQSEHPQGTYQFPKGDCGDNWVLYLKLPDDLCFLNITSDQAVNRKMAEIIQDQMRNPVDPEDPRNNVLFLALRALGWNIP